MAEESPWRKWVRTCGARYFEGLETEIAALRLPVSHSPPSFELVEVATPEWIAELGASAPSAIPVDRSCIIDGTGPAHTRCDWWKAAFLMLSAAYERDHEAKYGPVHSYRLRLPAAWEPMFRRPWANWIFLMLARQAAGRQIPIPRAEFHLTHDVDAIAKTLPTRLKQATFHTLNSGRSLVQGRVNTSIRTFGKALRMAFAPGDYWQFDRILSMEKERGFWSTWNFYGGKGGWGRSPRHILMDPMYDVSSPALRQLLRRISGEGWHIGLHQAYDSWDNPEPMRIEAEAVSTASGVPITCCRQHWLRFSFEKPGKPNQTQESGWTRPSASMIRGASVSALLWTSIRGMNRDSARTTWFRARWF